MISLVIPLFIGLPLGSWRSGAKLELCVPSTVIRFLGFLCDSLRQFFFLILPDKKVKFALGMSNVHWSKVNLNAK